VEIFPNFKIGDYVRISYEYSEPMLRGQIGRVAALPSDDLSHEYLLVLVADYSTVQTLGGRKILMHCRYFERA
jgi:hypothetical protein